MITTNNRRRRLESGLQITEALTELGIVHSEVWQNLTLSNLVRSIGSEKVVLEQDGNSLNITTEAAVVFVRFRLRNLILEVFEVFQFFKNTGRFFRKPRFDGLGETLKAGETPRNGARRLLIEELGFDKNTEEYPLTESGIQTLGPMESEKYPGLRATFIRYRFTYLPGWRLFKPIYIENRPNRLILYSLKPRWLK